MLDTYLAYKDESIIDYLKQYPAKMIDEKGNITGYKYEDFNLDNTRPARYILRMNNLFPEKKNEKALKTLFKQLENSLVQRTECGGTKLYTHTRYGSTAYIWDIRSTQWEHLY